MLATPYAELPRLGLGLGTEPERWQAVADGRFGDVELDHLELTVAVDDLRAYEVRAADFRGRPTITHAFGVSPCGYDGVDGVLLRAQRHLVRQLGSPWLLEDMAVWRMDGQRGHPFWPAPFDDDMVELVARRLPRLNRWFGRPFLCEFAPGHIAPGELTPVEFFRRLARRTGCGLVLDVSHWLTYAQLAARDPRDLLDEFPLENVLEVHVAGGERVEGTRWYRELHSEPLLSECVDLLDYTAARCPNLKAITIEHHRAEPQAIAQSLRTVAMLPSVRALRAGRDDFPAPAPDPDATAPDDAVDDPDWQALRLPGPERLGRRQRVVQRLLQSPPAMQALQHSAFVPAHDEDTGVADRCSLEQWQHAFDKNMRQIFDYTPVSEFVLQRALGSSGLGTQLYLEQRGTDAGPPSYLDCLEILSAHPDLPAWAHDAIAFDLDVQRVRLGLPPRQAHVVDDGEKFRVTYRRPVLATLRAIRRGQATPRPVPSTVVLEKCGERVTIAELR